MDECQDPRCTSLMIRCGSLGPKHGLCWNCRLRYMTSDEKLTELKGHFAHLRNKGRYGYEIRKHQLALDAVRREICRRSDSEAEREFEACR